MLPHEFQKRMKDLLSDEYDSFISSLEKDAVRGMRVNLIKGDPLIFEEECGFSLKEIPYAKGGYILKGEEHIGKSPYHHAGIIYMQDPGAMATVNALDIEPEWAVADLCAAPGGKSGQAAEQLLGGWLLSNEYVPKRARVLVGNLERLGVKNAVVTSLDTSKLRDMYRAVFNLVICDAPCSGEGMFRKSDEAILDWSVDNVRLSAKRQSEILENASELVRADGYLLYSTCTYAPEENELVVADFLRSHPDFHLTEPKRALIEATRPAIESLAPDIENLSYARRCYPHVTEGEGQFIALMKRKGGTSPSFSFRDAACEPRKEEMRAVCDFFYENLDTLPDSDIKKVGNNLVLIPHGVRVPPYSVFMSGVLIGEVRGKLLFPSHQLFSAYGSLFKRRVELNEDMAKRYLAGEEIDAPEGVLGYCALFYHGAALGGGKASGGKIKNHYPKGLRNK